MAKNQGNAKQHPDAVLLQFENYSHFSSTLSFKNNRHILKNKQHNKCVCIHEPSDYTINDNGNENQ